VTTPRPSITTEFCFFYLAFLVSLTIVTVPGWAEANVATGMTTL
jgi:hypothetical protein